MVPALLIEGMIERGEIKGQLTASAYRHWQAYRRDGRAGGRGRHPQLSASQSPAGPQPAAHGRRVLGRPVDVPHAGDREVEAEQHDAGHQAAPTSVSRAPIWSDSGPTSANDSGASAVETIQSIADTRPSSSFGTRLCIIVPQITMPTAKHTPISAATSPTCQTDPAKP